VEEAVAIIYRNGVAGKVCANPDCGWKPLSEFPHRRQGGQFVGDGYKSRCRMCANAQKRAERAAKPDQYREAARKYVAANLEHIRELKRFHQKANPQQYFHALRRYRINNRIRINEMARIRRAKNLEHYREIGRHSRAKHSEERNAYQRDYGKRNREKLTHYTNRRRARKLLAPGSHTEQEWQFLKRYYGYKCLCCGKTEPNIQLTRDHIVPLEAGGSDAIENIQPLCARCNSRKSTKVIDYR
jgi:5-methylcytosine-specific restriction endonuclease McrA